MIDDEYRRATWRERLQYGFDNVMARGLVAVMGLLGVASVLFVVVIAVVIFIVGAFPLRDEGEDPPTFFEVLWGNLMRTLDPGTMAEDQGWGFRAAMLVITIGGLILVASLIGIVSGAFDGKVLELRKGRSRVIENDHTLILGWSSKVAPIVAQLSIANESKRRPAIVVLADRDKVELEDELRAQIPRRSKTRLIVRRGDPMRMGDLQLGSPHTARSIILISPEDGSDPDVSALKTALALTNNPRRGARKLNIVGELRDAKNLEIATTVCGDEAQWILTREMISRLTAQACRQGGLSDVYTELLNFEGNEIYFSAEPTLIGSTYFEAQLAYATGVVIGVYTGTAVLLNPRDSYVIEQGQQLILIAEDDRAIRLGSPNEPNLSAIADGNPVPAAAPESVLILGYNADVVPILREINEYVQKGSRATIVANVATPDLDDLSNLDVEFLRGDTTNRVLLEGLDISEYEHIIVLAYRDTLDVQSADATTLVTLLHLRAIADRGAVELNIVSEMLDDRNREIAEVTRANDFIVSDKIVSLALAQLAENPMLTGVFETLFSSKGSEIYLRPAEFYVTSGVGVDFYTVLEAARRRGETAVGFRLAVHLDDATQFHGIRLNPPKSALVTFGPGDMIIVLGAE